MICGPGADVPDGALVIVDSVPEELTPVTFVAAGQLLVEAVARKRGVNPDAPSGLDKVTLTR